MIASGRPVRWLGAAWLLAASVSGAAQDRRPGSVAVPEAMRIGVLQGGKYDVRTIPMEEYVAGVLTGEAAPDSPPAAVETLAIAIRTYAAFYVGRHRTEGFDLCDQTHCQVLRRPSPTSAAAAASTAGQILLGPSGPAEIFYSASCGGHTERPSFVWPTVADHAYLPSRPDDACRREPVWSVDFTTADLERAFRAAGLKGGRLRDLRVISRNTSGRATEIRIDGFTPSGISGQDLRMALGPVLVKSAAVEIRRMGSGRFRFSGRGYVHGVGLCVIGSVNLAADGWTAARILAKYYPGVRVSPGSAAPTVLAPEGAQAPAAPNVSVAMAPPDESMRARVTALAAEFRGALVKKLSLSSTPPVVLRFHPSIESYELTTRLPWYTFGATIKDEMHFLPASALEARGVLDRTIRHEIVHALTDRYLVGRPLWVREGAAVYFAGADPKVETSGPRLPCPNDLELRQPTSPGGLSAALAQASSCFARQVAGGRSWLDVR
jgi:stage II sporulation protein D